MLKLNSCAVLSKVAMNSNNIAKVPYCQSCGMSLESPEVLGTNAAGAPVRDYCVYCFHHGSFTEPAISLDEMIERAADHLMMVEHMPHLQARDLAESVIPHLKRWDCSAMNQKIASQCLAQRSRVNPNVRPA